MKDEMATNNEKLENTSIRAETNLEELANLKLRIDKLEKEKDLNNQRYQGGNGRRKKNDNSSKSQGSS